MSFIFKITTTTSPQTFVIPCVNDGTFNATVDYGDGTGSQTVTAYNDSNLTHSFATAGQHTITIDGTFPNIRFYDNAASRGALDEVVDLGDVGWTNLGYAFRDCTNLTYFNGGTADTSNVTNMDSTFRDCSSLASLDVSSFDTSSVTTMYGLFHTCTSLTSLDLSSFDTSSVNNMQGMFFNCSSLTSLDLSNFDTSSVTTMGYMFYNCTNLTSLAIKHFDVSSVTNGSNFLLNANNALTTTQYDELLDAWAAQDVQPNVPWHFGDAQYTVETIADWYSPRSNSSLSIINNKLVSIADSTAVFGAAQQVDNLIIGNAYRFVGIATCSNSSATVRLRISGSPLLYNDFDFVGTGAVAVDTIFTATATTMYFGNITTGHAANDTVTIDAGITVKEITNYTEANAASEIEYSQENVFGAEEVVNGDFATDSDWNKGTGWTISGGKASSQNTTSSDFLTPNVKIGMIQGKSYEFTFNIVDYTNGSVTFAVFDGANGASPQFTNVGKHTWIYTAVRDNDQFVVRAGAAFTGSIDNVSVKRLIQTV